MIQNPGEPYKTIAKEKKRICPGEITMDTFRIMFDKYRNLHKEMHELQKKIRL
jgi:hypothetical protein